MPCLKIQTNQTVDHATEVLLKQELPAVLNKNEKWLMVMVEDKCRLWLAGDDAPAVMAEMSVFGNAAPAVYADMTAALTQFLSTRLNIPPSRIYIKYLETPYWGWDGKNL